MPSNTRQSILQKIGSLLTHIDWVIYHLNDLIQFYVDGITEYEVDYTEYINALQCLLNAMLEFQKAVERFRDEKV